MDLELHFSEDYFCKQDCCCAFDPSVAFPRGCSIRCAWRRSQGGEDSRTPVDSGWLVVDHDGSKWVDSDIKGLYRLSRHRCLHLISSLLLPSWRQKRVTFLFTNLELGSTIALFHNALTKQRMKENKNNNRGKALFSFQWHTRNQSQLTTRSSFSCIFLPFFFLVHHQPKGRGKTHSLPVHVFFLSLYLFFFCWFLARVFRKFFGCSWKTRRVLEWGSNLRNGWHRYADVAASACPKETFMDCLCVMLCPTRPQPWFHPLATGMQSRILWILAFIFSILSMSYLCNLFLPPDSLPVDAQKSCLVLEDIR